MSNRKLPDNPSDLIDLALDDLEKVEADRHYTVAMSVWHLSRKKMFGRRICSVCLAGAVMAKTLGVDRKASLVPSDICLDDTIESSVAGDTYNKLCALNHFRSGNIAIGLYTMGKIRFQKSSAIVTDYEEDPELFKADMRQIARELRIQGL